MIFFPENHGFLGRPGYRIPEKRGGYLQGFESNQISPGWCDFIGPIGFKKIFLVL